MRPAAIRILATLVLAGVLAAGCGGSREPDQSAGERKAPKADTAEQQALVQEHRELVKQGGTPTPEQRELYADAYYSLGARLWRQGRRDEAGRYFWEALRLRPEHARAMVRLGDLYAMKGQFKAAAQAYERAGQLDVGLRTTVGRRRVRLLNMVLVIADRRLHDYQIAGAREVLEFVQQYLADVGAEEAQRRLAEIEPLLGLERLVREAQADIAAGHTIDGYRKLREVATDHPRTYFAQEANRLLEEHGQKIVLHETATGCKLPLHWRRASTEHFEVFYEKRAALTGAKRAAEKAFAKIVSTFGMADARWQTRTTVYVFSDSEAWRDFVAANADKEIMEWARAFAAPWGNEIYMHVTEDTDELYDHILPHELAHVLHHRYVGGAHQPIFLKEGIAVSMERDGAKEARDEIRRRVKDGSAFPLAKLVSFSAYPDRDVRLFYAQSATVVGFIVDEYGLDGLKELMFAFRGTTDSVHAIEEVFGVSLDTFEKKWEKFVR